MIRNQAGQRVTFSLFDGATRIDAPTLVAADFRVDIDGGGQNPLSAVPTHDGAGLVTWLPTAAETNGRYIALAVNDASADEWDPMTIVFDTLVGSTVVDYLDAAISDICPCVTSWFAKHVTSIISRISGDDIQILRGDTMELSFSRMGSIADRDNIWFSVKDDKDNTDNNATIQIDELTGMLRIEGGAPTAAANGSITVTDAAAGNLTVWMDAAESLKLEDIGNFYYDIQVLYDDGTVSTVLRGRAYIIGDVTRRIV